ncbi:hypothetical protein ANCDUO_03050 [Ancylostoma duodenale]|uniref:Major facilitator superfamily (MFS) profile domain-containing protein n=1 Tax=Ancylostoma duodenale TaxID=51022 RepID=A0A0C2DUV0_9BILA|nr:hypothetical protein ANCDUO_03050 [Ancylostoma duodenale]
MVNSEEGVLIRMKQMAQRVSGAIRASTTGAALYTSKILGARRQGTMQGIMLMSGSLARTLGPLLVSWLFQIHGPIPVWGLEKCCCVKLKEN